MEKTVAVVTGASSGIGRATALRLARDFGAVILVARNATALDRAAEAVAEAGARPLVVTADLSLPAQPALVIQEIIASVGRIDALLNIAGAVAGSDLFALTDAEWDAGTALKLHGARRLTQQAWPALKAARGSVVFMSGSAAEMPTAGQAAVGTINAAVTALAKAFADQGLTDGVQVNSVAPGPVMTGRRAAMIEKVAGSSGVTFEEAQQTVLRKAGITRFGTPEEIANLMGYLVSPHAKWMTGSALRIDGGEIKSV